ncbi:MAG: hypothetical protein J0I93_13295 [Legionella sp.]|nr:hypothetical protein [Legionella sp.]
MGSLCSIFHARFKHLMRIIPSARKAQLMDYLLLGWQGSVYRLRDSTHVWFMKPYKDIVADTGIPQSSLERYIREFAQAGFIERRQALYSRTSASGAFEVKKGTYIALTAKFLSLIQAVPEEQPATVEQKMPPEDCAFFNPNEGTGALNLRESNIRDLYSSVSNTITLKSTGPVGDNSLAPGLQRYQTVARFLDEEVREEIPEEVKHLLRGTFYNLLVKHAQPLSNPKQVVAEYLFALINIDHYLPEISCFKHRNNVLAKLIRRKAWRTPKGFYDHFYLGAHFKDQQALREARWQEQKAAEIQRAPHLAADLSAGLREAQLQALEARMVQHSTRLEQYTEALYAATAEQDIEGLREQIREERAALEALWAEQYALESESAAA